MRSILVSILFVCACLWPPAYAGVESAANRETAERPDSTRTTPYVAIGAARLDTARSADEQIPRGWTHEAVAELRGEPDPYYLVKFSGPVGSEVPVRLGAHGFSVIASHPYDSFLVRPLPGRSAEDLARVAGVVWTGRLHPYFKIDSEIADAVAAGDPVRLNSETAGWGLRFSVVLHEGQQRGPVEPKIEAIPGVLELLPSRGPIRVRLSPDSFVSALRSIAALQQVSSIERWLPAALLNDENVQAGQSGSCNASGPEAPNTPIFSHGLTGWNTRIAVADTCIDANEGWFYDDALARMPAHEPSAPWTSASPDWAQRKIVEYYDMYSGDLVMGCDGAAGTPGNPDHGTHVTGTIAGNCSLDAEGVATATDAANSDGDNDGMAPGAKIIAQDLGNAALTYFNGDGGDLGELLRVAYLNTCDGGDCGIDAHNDSWGVSSDGYTVDARTGDAELWNHKDMIVVVSQGNAGPGFDTVRSPATGKNIIGVGSALDCSVGDLASGSSRGDTEDGRLKPDIVVTGNDVTSALNDGHGDNNDNGGCTTFTDSGTSYASPTAVGLAALVHQYFDDGFYPSGSPSPADEFDPSGMLLKAMLINAGQRMEGSGAEQNGVTWPNMDQGYGYVVLDEALYFSGDGRGLWVHDESVGVDVSGTTSLSFRRQVTSPFHPLKVTLVWYDKEHDGSCGSVTPCLLNDLDLTVLDESTGTPYSVTLVPVTPGHLVPRTVVPSSPEPGQTTVDNGPDALNTVEQIIIPSPTNEANYTFTVTAANTPDGPIPFALVATGALDKPCEEPTTPPNNGAEDLAPCGDTGVQISWAPNVADWGDGGEGVRYYRVLRDGIPILSGDCSGNLVWGTGSCIDNTAPNGVSRTYRVVYENGCGVEAITSGAAAMDQAPPVVDVTSTSATTVCPGVPIDFSVAVTPPGGSYSYQWSEDGATMPGENGTVLGVTKGSPGVHIYNCAVTDLATGCTVQDAESVTGLWTIEDADVAYDGSFDPLTTLAESCGDGDALVEPGEYWQVTTRLENYSSCSTAINVRADLEVNAGSIVTAELCNATGYYGTIPPGGTASYTYTFEVDPSAVCGEDIVFDLGSIWWRGGGIVTETAAFAVEAGQAGSGVNESATQTPDPLNVSDGQNSAFLTPAFSLATADQGQLDYVLNCDIGPPVNIYTDAFDNLSGWTQSGSVDTNSDATDSCSGGNGNNVHFNGNGTITRGVSTAGYTEIQIQADFVGIGQYQNPTECFNWWYSTNAGGNWTLYKSICGASLPEGPWSCAESFAFPSSADDKSGFQLRFETTGNVEARLDGLKVKGREPACDVTNNTRVELIRSGGGGTYLIKELGDPDPPKPIDVTSYYNDLDGGPGTWLLRIREDAGGTAILSAATMSLTQGASAECDLTSSCSCPAGLPGEVSDDPQNFLLLGKSGSNVDLVFEDLGVASYNVYVSSAGTTSPFPVTAGQGKTDCSIAHSPGGGGALVATGYDVETGITAPTDVYYILLTGDNGSPDEGTLGFASSGNERSADSYCAH